MGVVVENREELARLHGTSVLSSLFVPKLEDWWRKNSPAGLSFDICWLSANLRTEDGESWYIYRSWQNIATPQYYEQYTAADGTQTNRQAPDDHYLGMMYFEYNEDKTAIKLNNYTYPGMTEEKNMSVTIEPQKIRWIENNGQMDITYTAMGPAMRWLTLGGEIKEEVYYQVEEYLIEGTINGKKVTGYGSMDYVFQSPGMSWQQNKIYGFIEEMWCPWVTFYENGDKYYGHFLRGCEGWKIGYFVKNGKAIMDNDYTLDIEWDETGQVPLVMRADIQGHKFEWTPDVKKIGDASNRPTIGYSVGTCRALEQGDNPIDYHGSWIEYRPYYLWGETAQSTVYQ